MAQYAYAWALDEGKGIRKNEREAERLYAAVVEGLKSLADKGDLDAMTALGEMYENGDGVAKNRTLAAEWYTKAAEKGHAYAMYCLADCYKDGDGVIRSIQQARIWYQKAAEAGYRKALRELRELDEDDD
jgi:hypothetical protein